MTVNIYFFYVLLSITSLIATSASAAEAIEQSAYTGPFKVNLITISSNDFEAHVLALRKSKPVKEFSKEIDTLIARTKTIERPDLMAILMSYKFKEMVNFGQISEVKSQFEKYLTITETYRLRKARMRILRAQMHISDIEHDKKLSGKIRTDLINLAQNEIDLQTRARLYHSIGGSFKTYEYNDEAFRYLKLALDLFEEIKDDRGIIVVANTLADMYGSQSEPELAIRYFELALNYAEKKNDEFLLSVILYNIGHQYKNMSASPKAEPYLTKALEISTKLNDERGIAFANRTLGNYYREYSKFDKAFTHLSTAYNLFGKQQDSHNVVMSGLSLVRTHIDTQQFIKADTLLKEIVIKTEQLPHDQFTLRTYEILYDLRKAQGKSAEALEALENYTNRLEAQFKKDKEQSVENLLIKFDSERTEIENKLLKQENQITELRFDEQQKSLTIWVLSFLFVLTAGLVIIIVLVRQTRMKRRLKSMAFFAVNIAVIFPICLFFFPSLTDVLPFKKTNPYLLPTFIIILQVALYVTLMHIMKQQKLVFDTTINMKQTELNTLRAQSNPHFLFNTLNLIESEISTNPENAKASIYDLSDLLRSAVKLSQHNFSSLKSEFTTALHYLNIQQRRFRDRLEFDVDLPEECEEFVVPSLLVLPLVENTIKHAVAPYSRKAQIKLSANIVNDETSEENKLQIRIKDSGPKVDLSSVKAGEGTRILKRTFKLIYPDCHKIKFDSTDEGAELILTIPAEKKRE